MDNTLPNGYWSPGQGKRGYAASFRDGSTAFVVNDEVGAFQGIAVSGMSTISYIRACIRAVCALGARCSTLQLLDIIPTLQYHIERRKVFFSFFFSFSFFIFLLLFSYIPYPFNLFGITRKSYRAAASALCA